jgi:hypothetical protein
MKLHSAVSVNGKKYPSGSELAWYMVYPFFLVHMLAFGLSGFFMAYSSDGPDVSFLYLHGGFAIFVYVVFYFALFGVDQVRWMFINAALGLYGIYAQINLILSLFGKQADQFPWYVHVIPFGYYVLYTFLLYQMVLDLSGARHNESRKKIVEGFYVVGSIVVYTLIWFAGR